MIEGGCLCGAVRYKTQGPLRPVIACHCQQCRKTTGNYVTATSAPRGGLIITGEPTWYASSETAKRAFCPLCGSQLFWDGGGENFSIMAGTIDGETGLTVAGHIFIADKGDYYDIPEGIPAAEQDDPAFTTWVST